MGQDLCNPHELLELVRGGDIEALDRMTQCFGERMLAMGRRHCRTDADAEDAVQDALLSAGQNLARFRGDGTIEGWLVRMVANFCRQMRRGRKNDSSLHQGEPDEQTAAGAPDPEALVHQQRLAQALGVALLALPPRDRALLLLTEGAGWTAPELADAFDMSSSSVRTRLSRTRRRLRSGLEELRADLDR